MKKIMVFYPGYIPGKRYGGPVTSIYHFAEMMGDIYDIRIVCKNHDFMEKREYDEIKDGWNQVGKAKVLYLSDKEFCGKTFERVLVRENVDLIYSSSVFSAKMNLPLMRISRNRRIPMILAPRGELSKDRMKHKWYKKYLYILYLRLSRIISGIWFQATSAFEYQDIYKVLKVDNSRIFMIPNIPCSVGKKLVNEKQKGQIKILATSRIHPKNNLLYSIRVANKIKSNVIFDIYGPREDSVYWDLCEKEIAKAPDNVTYKYKGICSVTEIESVYLGYDCLIHPTHSENYGHVIVEALCHECPIVISRGTTPWDDVEQYNAGITCSLDNMEEFIEAIEKIALMGQDEYEELLEGTRKFVGKLNIVELQSEYKMMILKVMENKR